MNGGHGRGEEVGWGAPLILCCSRAAVTCRCVLRSAPCCVCSTGPLRLTFGEHRAHVGFFFSACQAPRRLGRFASLCPGPLRRWVARTRAWNQQKHAKRQTMGSPQMAQKLRTTVHRSSLHGPASWQVVPIAQAHQGSRVKGQPSAREEQAELSFCPAKSQSSLRAWAAARTRLRRSSRRPSTSGNKVPLTLSCSESGGPSPRQASEVNGGKLREVHIRLLMAECPL